jgi:hypothetical protein
VDVEVAGALRHRGLEQRGQQLAGTGFAGRRGRRRWHRSGRRRLGPRLPGALGGAGEVVLLGFEQPLELLAVQVAALEQDLAQPLAAAIATLLVERRHELVLGDQAVVDGQPAEQACVVHRSTHCKAR